MNIIKLLGRGIKRILNIIGFCLVYLFALIFIPCRPKNKNIIRKTDEFRVFVSNHLEIYGPLTMYMYAPTKKAFWINEKLMDEKMAEDEMRLAVMDPNNFKWAPKWLKTVAVKILKSIGVYIFRHRAKGIPILRGNTKDLIRTFKLSLEAMKRGRTVVICPEVEYPKHGMGELFTGFATLGKYVYKHTGKIVSFYPVYVDKDNKRMTFCEPIDYDPNNINSVDDISNYIFTTVNEVAKNSPIKHKKKKGNINIQQEELISHEENKL